MKPPFHSQTDLSLISYFIQYKMRLFILSILHYLSKNNIILEYLKKNNFYLLLVENIPQSAYSLEYVK